MLVGIPYYSLEDPTIELKMNTHGYAWYESEAFVTVNQAIGRAIRHRHDYGCVVLLDERYEEEQRRA